MVSQFNLFEINCQISFSSKESLLHACTYLQREHLLFQLFVSPHNTLVLLLTNKLNNLHQCIQNGHAKTSFCQFLNGTSAGVKRERKCSFKFSCCSDHGYQYILASETGKVVDNNHIETSESEPRLAIQHFKKEKRKENSN